MTADITAAASLLLNIIVAVVGLTFGVAKVRRSVEEVIHREITNVRRDFGSKFEEIQKKIAEMELWNRDNFARRDSVHALGGRLEQQIMISEERVIGQVNKLENRLEDFVRTAQGQPPLRKEKGSG